MKKRYIIPCKGRAGTRDGAAQWAVYAWIDVVVYSLDFLDLSLYLSCMFLLSNHAVEILVKMLGSECLLGSKLH